MHKKLPFLLSLICSVLRGGEHLLMKIPQDVIST